MSRSRFLLLAPPVALALALAACGDTAPLRPAAGKALPVKPAMASRTPTPEELLAPIPMAHPERVDELMKRSAPRTADRFDLPPPDGNAAPVPPTDGDEETDTRVSDPR